MADSDLFMECEEEELAPWQQAIDEVDDEEMNEGENTAPPSVTLTPHLPAESKPAASVDANKTVLLIISNPPNPISPPVTPTPAMSGPVIPKLGPNQQLLLTQGPTGMMLQPLQVVNSVVPSPKQKQKPANGVRVMLGNKPVTLFPVPGAQLLQPVVGVPQVLSLPPPVATVTTDIADANTASQVTITPQLLSLPGSQEPPVLLQASVRNPSVPSAPPSVVVVQSPEKHSPPPPVVTVISKPGTVNPQKLKIVMNSGGTPSAPLPTSKTNKERPVSGATSNKICQRCGAQFRTVDILRGKMCFCSPELRKDLHSLENPVPQEKLPIAPKPAAAKATPPKVKATPPKPSPEPVPLKPRLASVTQQESLEVTSTTTVSPLNESESASGSTDSRGKLVMLVDDFYYGSCQGNGNNGSIVSLQGIGLQFTCIRCNKKLKSNIKLMNHMKHHVRLDFQNGDMDSHTYCQHCYRHFATPFRLQCHVESVHSQYESSTKCKICEWDFETEPLLLQHMKEYHKPGEMPYICQVCEYRSSFYSDLYNHFCVFHRDTSVLLCLYCLKVFKTSANYQNHFLRHQKKKVLTCDCCRLQFIFSKTKVDHALHHKTFRKPPQLEGLQPGTRVTIRAYATQQNQPKNHVVSPAAPAMPAEAPPPQPQEKQPEQTKQESVSMLDVLKEFQPRSAAYGEQTCLECTFQIPTFVHHFPTYVSCSQCHYKTCCSRAYANHMISNHVHRKDNRKYPSLFSKPPRVPDLVCASCNFTTRMGDRMARHLVQEPSHSCLMDDHERGQTPAAGLPSSGDATPPNSEKQPEETQKSPQKADAVYTEDDDEEASEDGAENSQPLTPHQLRIVLHALCHGVLQATAKFEVTARQVRSWLRHQEQRAEQDGRGQCREDAASQLQEWMLARREQHFPVRMDDLRQLAAGILKRDVSSLEWTADFLLRHQLGTHIPDTLGRRLIPKAEERIDSFLASVREATQAKKVAASCIGCMDELPIFLDMNLLKNEEAAGKELAFQLEGTGPPQVDVVITMLADGTLLPPAVFFRGLRLPAKPPSGVCVLLESRLSGFNHEEVLRGWFQHIWQPKVSGGPSLLVTDAFCSHRSANFLAALEAAGTRSAVVPVGCAAHVLPLEVGFAPVLRDYLVACWLRCAKSGNVRADDVPRLLVAWLEEAVSQLGSCKDLLVDCFHLARVLGDNGQPANSQAKVLSKLRKALFSSVGKHT